MADLVEEEDEVPYVETWLAATAADTSPLT